MFSRLFFVVAGIILAGNPKVWGEVPSGTYLDWAAQAWGSDRTNSLEALKGADPDLDGLRNFLEYATGLNPVSADAGRFPTWRIERTNGATEARLGYATVPSAREADLGVLWRRNAATGAWMAPDQVIVRDQALPAMPSGEVLHEVRIQPTAGEPAVFARLAATEVASGPRPEGFVWFEAEPPNHEANTNLSGGQMVWCAPGAAIQKSVTIPSDGRYQFWARKFWNPQTFRWRVGTTDTWKNVNNPPLQDLVVLGPGRQVGWILAGEVELTAGLRTFRLEVTDGGNTTAYDCFVLTREPFTPRGKLKPGDPLPDDGSGWFGFLPQNDPFDLSVIDLRWLNERQAGDGGFIEASGEEFVHSATGQPVRFWAVNTGNAMSQRSAAEIEVFARTLAKYGVNLVRIHGPTYVTSGTGFGRNDTNQVHLTQTLIRALKRQGIYSCLSIYFPLWVTLGPENTEFPGYANRHPFALPYFNAQFQALYRTWWDCLLTTPEPETGVALKDEPALAMIEMVNEDSLFFWTFDPYTGQSGNIPDAQRAIVEKQFGDWLLARYPGQTLSQIRSSVWSGLSTAQDAFAEGRVGIRPLWNMANERTKRDQDTAQFLTELQTAFYTQTYSYLKQTLRYRGLVYASNWQTASAQYLGPLDKWSNAVADFLDRHGYFGAYHSGTDSSWSIQSGQIYDDRAAVKFQAAEGSGQDFNNPIFDIIYNGQPSTISEVNWPPPNRYRADFPVLAAAYGSLQGSDGVFHFAAGSPAWDGTVAKFSIQTPADMGQFPATALMYRRGLVKTAPRVVDVELALTNLYALKGTPIPAPVNFDQLRSVDVPPGSTLTNVSVLDSLAFTVGRVAVEFVTNRTTESQVLDLGPYVDRTNRVARSQTGELEWDWAQGVVRISAPQAQGLTGFLSAPGTVDLADLTIRSTNEYGSILVVALDDRPIVQSSRMLLQVMTEEKPYGWATDVPTGQRTITNVGQPPVMVREVAGFVALKRADAAGLRVTPLDFNGYRDGLPVPHGPGIQLTRDRLYYLVEK